MAWLRMIGDHVINSFHLVRDDLDMAPIGGKGDMGRMYKLFGNRMGDVIDEMNEGGVGGVSCNRENQLPLGWSEAPLGQLLTVLRGVSYKKQDAASEPASGKIPILRATNIDAELNFDDLVYVPQEYVNKVQLLKPGDMVIAASSGSRHVVGKAAFLTVPWVGSFGAFCYGLRPYLQETASYIFLFLQTSTYRDYVSTLSAGVNINNLRREHIEGVSLPVPPLNEQLRIVAKIEELFSELDKGIESLKTARARLDVYRQAVLKHAFEGKLTAQWREENRDKLETPEELFARIKQERETRYEQQLKEWEESDKSGRKPPKPQNPKNPLAISASPVHNPFWTHLFLDDLAVESVLGKMLDREKNTGAPRPYLGNINLRWGKFDLENLKTMKVEESEIERYRLARGDLVICEGGEPGRCAVWEGQEPTMLIQKALHRVRFTESYSPYFAFYFMTYAAKSGLLSPNLTGSTIKHLTGKGLGNVLFPLCTLAEQEQIVRHLDSIVTLCDELDRQIEDQMIRANALRQSILKKALTGQLVPQDPNDEPASILLERIKAEKAAQGQNNTRARRRRTAATA